MKHDPESSASAYLSGAMSARQRGRFEEHILGCEDCWSEVSAGRSGRAVAESARELAAQELRERVRASVAASDPPRGPRMLVLGSGVALLAVVAVAGLLLVRADPGQPRAIDAVLADFRGEEPVGEWAMPGLPHRIGDMELIGSQRGYADDLAVTVHRYATPNGDVVAVYQAEGHFPPSQGAVHADGTWSANVNGTALYCIDAALSSLVVGDRGDAVHLVATRLGLSP